MLPSPMLKLTGVPARRVPVNDQIGNNNNNHTTVWKLTGVPAHRVPVNDQSGNNNNNHNHDNNQHRDRRYVV